MGFEFKLMLQLLKELLVIGKDELFMAWNVLTGLPVVSTGLVSLNQS